MEHDKKALSDITVFNKYAKYVPELQRRENYSEIIERNMNMHIKKFPKLEQELRAVYRDFVQTKKVLPSMRSLQFGGRPIEMNESRIYNCAYMPAEAPSFFSELMFLLLGGTGVGYSVQQKHVLKLPTVQGTSAREGYKYQIQDSIIGWADAVKVLVKAHFNGTAEPIFDFRDIREKGAELVTTGGLAPGAEPLRVCLAKLKEVLEGAGGNKLLPIEVHDMACIIADAVLAGGIRRAAMISLFDHSDEDMLKAKSGNWWETHPHRARANNSAVLHRNTTSKETFEALMQRVRDSGCGEPGIYWTNMHHWGTNPCVEIALRPYQMCNLTEINAGNCHTQEELNARARAAALLGTVQAAYTDFHYLNPQWKETCERDALLGVSMTGIASGAVMTLDLEEAAEVVVLENQLVAKCLGINEAARTTAVKPAGTTSLVLGTSSGIHAWHNDYYIRRMRAGANEALAKYMIDTVPELVEFDEVVPNQVVLAFPQKAPKGATLRTESMLDLLERVRKVSNSWVQAGHVSGGNAHNVSCTISVKDNEWEELTKFMWEHRDSYNGISVLPYYGAEAYAQMPFEDCTEEQYLELLQHLEKINIEDIKEFNARSINLAGELACAGGTCEIM